MVMETATYQKNFPIVDMLNDYFLSRTEFEK